MTVREPSAKIEPEPDGELRKLRLAPYHSSISGVTRSHGRGRSAGQRMLGPRKINRAFPPGIGIACDLVR